MVFAFLLFQVLCSCLVFVRTAWLDAGPLALCLSRSGFQVYGGLCFLCVLFLALLCYFLFMRFCGTCAVLLPAVFLSLFFMFCSTCSVLAL